MGLTILILIDQLNVGGTETHVLTLAKQLIKEGTKVIIGTSGGPLLDLFQANGLEIAYLPFKSDDPISDEYLELLAKVRELVIKENIDLIHAHSIGGLKVAVQVSQELLVPTVATIHGLFYSPRKLRGLIERCPYVIAVSHPVVQWLRMKVDYPLNRIALIPNGIDTKVYTRTGSNNSFREELELTPDHKLLLIISRLAWTKTRVVEIAIEAAVELSRSRKIKLAIIGSGPNASLIHATASLANRKSKQDLVSVLGWRLNTMECYQAADVVIGTARVALEAMSCERPVIAAGNISYFDILTPDNLTSAWKVYFGDHKWHQPITASQITKDVEAILDNQNYFLNIGKQNRQWVIDNFDITRVAKETVEFYRSVLELEKGQTSLSSQSAQLLMEPVVDISVNENNNIIIQDLPSLDKPVVARTDMVLLLEQKPLVSVAIPAYNTANYLKECLDSIANQTYRPLEIVLVNDGSTDNTEDMALKWWDELANKKDLSFVYQALARNTGYSAAQSAAYQLSRGQYIANQDSDDISDPKRIETELLFLLTNPDYSLVGCNFNSFKDSLENKFRSYLLKYGFQHIINTYHDGGHCICFGTLLFKREVFHRVGGLTAFLKGAEDFEWITRVLNQGFYVDNLKEVLYFYRQHEGQISRLNRELRLKLETLGRAKDGS